MNIDIPTLEALEAYVRGDDLSIADRSRLRAWITTDPSIRDDIARSRARSCVRVTSNESVTAPTTEPRDIKFDPLELARHLGLVPPVSERAKRLAAAALDPNDPDHGEAMRVLGLPSAGRFDVVPGRFKLIVEHGDGTMTIREDDEDDA